MFLIIEATLSTVRRIRIPAGNGHDRLIPGLRLSNLLLFVAPRESIDMSTLREGMARDADQSDYRTEIICTVVLTNPRPRKLL